MDSVRLSREQRKAVEYQDGALLVIAGPGSGKTRILTERINRLLSERNAHFHVLALTFTNKAANEMRERLKNNPRVTERAFIGTLHSFCMEMLKQRGKSVGIEGLPNIFNTYQDRKEVLLQAIYDDPDLLKEIKSAGDHKQQKAKCDLWMQQIANCKGALISPDSVEDDMLRKAYDGYNAKLRASGAVDYDDLLFFSYELLQTRPKVASFYRRLYQYICIDEAQDLNQAQYGVIKALCGDSCKNVMMVGDPKQSIYGFINADPQIMHLFAEEFDANKIELVDNYRSSRRVVEAAKGLNPNYEVMGRLPIDGCAQLIPASDEEQEAQIVITALRELLNNGHADIEGDIKPSNCAILGRTRYTLLQFESKLREEGIDFYKIVAATHEYETDTISEFLLAMRVLVNPKDILHLNQLCQKWKCLNASANNNSADDGIQKLSNLAQSSNVRRSKIINDACNCLIKKGETLDMQGALKIIGDYGSQMEADEKREIYEDIAVLRGEWDRYLRGKIGSTSDLQSFLAHIALGTTQQMYQDGVALLTVHASKGLEFDVVFLIGMSEGVFPDYRATNSPRSLEEEKRNAFVAVSRSKRLLFVSYPQKKTMPWGDIWLQKKSRFIDMMQLKCIPPKQKFFDD